MRYYRFLEDAVVHVIDYSGKVDLAEGLFRMMRAHFAAITASLVAYNASGIARSSLMPHSETGS